MILDHFSQKLKVVYFPAIIMLQLVATGIMLHICSQHMIVLVIQFEFPPKHYEVTLLLTSKEKLQNAKELAKDGYALVFCSTERQVPTRHIFLLLWPHMT